MDVTRRRVLKTGLGAALSAGCGHSNLEDEILAKELTDVPNFPPKAGGCLIRNVAKNSPAENIGLRGGTKVATTIDGHRIVLGGDILLGVEGITADSVANLIKIRSLLAGLNPGALFKASIFRSWASPRTDWANRRYEMIAAF